MFLRIVLASAFSVAFVLAAITTGHNATHGAGSERTGDVIVRFRHDATFSAVAQGLDEAKVDPERTTPQSGLVLVRPRNGQSVDDAIQTLRARPDVEFAEADTVVHIATTPNDPLYAQYQWDATKIGLPAAWDRTTGSSAVVVAVIDTGVDGTHPELSAHMVPGWNVIAGTANSADDNSHGTFVAGIIAATGNNGAGIAGVCWTCKIMPVKALDAQGNGSMFGAAQAIDWAVAHGANVINMSFGGAGGSSALQTSVDNAWAAGVVLVAASGNDNGAVMYPAAYAHVIAVGSSSQSDARSSFSNYGPELDLVAPGENIVSTLCTCAGFSGGYGSGGGTSFAAPHVAGVAALIIASGTTSNSAIVSKLTSSATDINSAGFDNETGFGRLNAAAAVGATYSVSWAANTFPTTTSAGSSAPVSVSFTNSGTLTWSNAAPNPVRFAYHWKSGSCPGGSTVVQDGVRTGLLSSVGPGSGVSSLAATVVAPPTGGTYCLVYDLVREGVTWFSSQGAAVQTASVNVSTPVYGVTWGSDSTPSSLAAGSTNTPTISFTNAGSLTWSAGGANPVHLAYHWRNGACPGSSSAIFNGARTGLAANVSPAGSVNNLSATVVAPGSTGTYCLVYDLVREGVTWFSSQGAATKTKTVTVTPPVYAVSWGAHNTPSTMAEGSGNSVNVTFTNTGTLTWASGGANPVHLSYHWRNGACPGSTVAAWDGTRAVLPSDTSSGATVSSLSTTVNAPASPGAYCLVYDLVREGVTWFSTQGASTLSVTINVS